MPDVSTCCQMDCENLLTFRIAGEGLCTCIKLLEACLAFRTLSIRAGGYQQ